MIYKNILVAIDGSKIANIALHEALKFCKKDPVVNLRLLYILDAEFANWSMQPICPKDIVDSMRESGLELLKETKEAVLAAGVKNVETKIIELKTKKTRVADEIQKEALTWPADLIVLGTHGRRGFSEVVLGSVAIGVVKISTKPVLLVRGHH
ncbi:MAG: universal stress protein [Candidatus Berkiellales bacterium]